MTDFAKLHSAWKTERDKHVKKGAVSGVSIGDAIDDVTKAMGKGYTATLTAIAALEKAVAKYTAKLGKDQPKLVKWMEANILAEAKDLKAKVSLDVDSLKWVTNNLLAGSDINILTILPDEGMLSNANAVMEKDKVTFAAALKKVGMFEGVEAGGAMLAKRAMTLKNMKWNAPLTKHAAHYATLGEFADTALDDVKKVIIWSKSDTIGAFADMMKVMRQKKTAVEMLAPAQKAMKALLA